MPLLSLLRIKNLALVEELEWELAPGFIAITGETGAGKSIIIGALQLLLGERADKSLIRTGAEACTVEAVFVGGDFAATERPSGRIRHRAVRGRVDLQTQLLVRRKQPAIRQRFADDPRRS